MENALAAGLGRLLAAHRPGDAMIFLGTDARGFMKAQKNDLEEHELLLMQLVRFADTENISKELILEGLVKLEDRMGLPGWQGGAPGAEAALGRPRGRQNYFSLGLLG